MANSLRGTTGGGKQLRALASRIPADTDFHGMVLGLEQPGHTVASRDRYIAIVGSGAVEYALQTAISKHLTPTLSSSERETLFQQTIGDFARRIAIARGLGIVSAENALELNRLRVVRNAFAHTVAPVTFDDPAVADVMHRVWHIPVASWDTYFFTSFPLHRQYIIICAAFYSYLDGYLPGQMPPRRAERKPAAEGDARS
ncbi:hypothetical protein [uncultured Phenylobacterium sp.]|uniref:hypothetical protein n=1 Tax=uncultured Phenylobacterium sp. TaxID=349273 RepID=UPI0025EBD3E3|nr:hypothetical protein [uncultured Phenylobacterium sp.]